MYVLCYMADGSSGAFLNILCPWNVQIMREN